MLIIGLSVLVWQYGLFNIKQLLLELLKKIEVIFYFNKTYSFILLSLFSLSTETVTIDRGVTSVKRKM